MHFGIRDYGMCRYCQETFDSENRTVSNFSVSDTSYKTLAGTDITRRNVELVRNISRYGQTENKFHFNGITLFGIHGAGRNELGRALHVPECWPGEERCRIRDNVGAPIPAIPPDELVYDLIKENWIAASSADERDP